jgi:O-6-methylguanine DNA methyltransferase
MTFQDRVLNLCRKIPKGKVSTYKEIGKALKGRGQICRAVGRALHDNKLPVVIPCHRVVCSDGSLGGYAKGSKKKIELLKQEGVEVKKGKIVNFEKRLFRF